MTNYVKFMRGTPSAYAALSKKDSDTLYFISEKDSSDGILYLGEKVIASNEADFNATSINALKDVQISENLEEGSFLVYDTSIGQWVNKTLEEAISVFIGSTSTANGLSGLVPAPSKGQTNLFLRSDGSWAAIAEASHLKRKIVYSIEEIYDFMDEEDAEQYIFMLSSGSEDSSNKYEEYIIISTISDDGTENKTVERIGSLEANLEDYLTINKANELLDKKVDKIEGSRLISEGEAEKLNSSLLIKAVDGTLSLDLTTNQLGVKEISTSKINDLSSWVTSHKNIVSGLSEENFTTEFSQKLANIQEGAEKNYVRSVSEELEVTEEGQLNIKTIALTKVSNLSKLLAEKAEVDQVNSLATSVGILETDVSDIKLRLTWSKI